MNNLKNAKEVKGKVDEIIKKRTKCTKNEDNPPKKSGVSKKMTKKEQKEQEERIRKEQEKKKKIKRFLIRLLVWEYITASIILLVAFNYKNMKSLQHLENVNKQQQLTISTLVNMLNARNEDIKIEDTKIEEKKLAYNLTTEERELLAQLLYHEARGESLECQKAVVSVVLNRMKSGIWGDTLKEVIYAKNQFEPVSRGLLPNTKPLKKQYEAIDYVLENGTTIPEDVLYFRANHYFEWGTAYMNMDNTYFSF